MKYIKKRFSCNYIYYLLLFYIQFFFIEKSREKQKLVKFYFNNFILMKYSKNIIFKLTTSFLVVVFPDFRKSNRFY